MSAQKNLEYASPEIELYYASVEKGFAYSNSSLEDPSEGEHHD